MYKTLAQKLIEARKQEKSLRSVFIDENVKDKEFTISVETRALSIDEDKKQVTFVMSTSNIDRHGDIIDQESWMLEHFNKNPAFFLQHRSDEFPLGKWLKVWFEADPDNIGKKRMVGTAEFRTEFDEPARAFAHVKAGDMNAVSVGFIPHRIDYDEETDAFILYDCELLECSLVGIPSNRQALVKEGEEKTILEKTIEVKNELDMQIKVADDEAITDHLSARESLNKAIRSLRDAQFSK